MPMARAPSTTVKLSQERKVRSLAKKTLGSTRVGSAMRLPVGRGRLVGELARSWMTVGTNPARFGEEVGWTW
jgi:hypothetical protein